MEYVNLTLLLYLQLLCCYICVIVYMRLSFMMTGVCAACDLRHVASTGEGFEYCPILGSIHLWSCIDHALLCFSSFSHMLSL